MATTPQQLFIRTRLTDVTVPIDTTVASGVINSGDMVYWTDNSPAGAASLSTPGTDNANAATFIGVSLDTYPIPVAQGIVETDPSETPSVVQGIRVGVEGDWQMIATDTDTFAPFASAYLGANGQTVSTSSTGDAVGTVSPDQRPNAQSTTGGSAAAGTLGGSVVGTGSNYVIIHISPNLL